MFFKSRQDGRILARSAAEAKKYMVLQKILKACLGCLLIVLTVTYIVSVLYSKFGSFTVTVNKLDSVNYGLSLSESDSFDSPVVRLNAKDAEDITNISGASIPKDVDSINGSHNGDNYLAYTFYCTNAGKKEVTYEYHWYIANVVNDVDKAIRMELYVDGEPVVYARTRSDGGGPEPGTKEFLSTSSVVRNQISNFKPGDVTKYTVVIWLEGDDPDCIDDLMGGQLKSDMTMTVVD